MRLTTLSFAFSLITIMAQPVLADRLHVNKLGSVVITGKAGEPYRILIDGQVFAEDNETWSLSIADADPNDQNPNWVLLGYGDGGNMCEGTYRILDLSGSAPKLSDEFGNCLSYELLKTPSQAVFDFQNDTWVYSGHGLSKMPILNAEQNVRQGVDAYKGGDYDRAVRHLWPQREGKNPEAPFYLGLMSHLGKGLLQDYRQAMAYYDQAGKMGHAPGFFRIGTLYANGRGVEKDLTAANLWYQRGADLGDGVSMYNLGLNLLTGAGAPKNPREALRWFLLAEERLVDPKDLEAARKNAKAAEALLTPEEAVAVKSDAGNWKRSGTKLFATASELRAWIGKAPWERVNGYTIYDVNELMVRMKIALGEMVASKIPTMDVSSDATEENGWLRLSGCTAHNCDVSHYVLAVNLTTYDIMGCARQGDDWMQPQQHLTFGGSGYTQIDGVVADRERDLCDVEVLNVNGLRAILDGGMRKAHRNAPVSH